MDRKKRKVEEGKKEIVQTEITKRQVQVNKNQSKNIKRDFKRSR